MRYDYDLVVLGAGSGGVRVARLASQLGVRAAVIEEDRIGGTCVIRGCVPKKLLVIGSGFSEDLADMAGFGWTVGQEYFDWPRLIAAKNAEVARLEAVYARILRDNGVEIIPGRGLFVDPHTLEVEGRVVTAERILVATGSRPTLPAVPGIQHVVTSNEALDLMQLPRRIVVVGGGYIAVEFAGIFNAFGVEVTQVLRGDTVLRGFDEDVRAALAEEMIKKGIDLRLQTVVSSIERAGGVTSLRLSGNETIETDLVLYATGRRPNTDGIGLTEIGVRLDGRGAVVVDRLSCSSVPSIFAVGDVTDRVNLTPVALAEAKALVDTLYLGKQSSVDYASIATAVFSRPPVACVGLTEAHARRRHSSVDVYLSRFRPMRNVLARRDELTLMKMVVERPTDRVLGIHMVGPDAPEIIQGFAVAMRCGVTKSVIDGTIGIHPTAAEEFVTMRDRRPAPAVED